MEKVVGYWYPNYELKYEAAKKAYAGLPYPRPDSSYESSDEQRRFVKTLWILEREVHRYHIAHLETQNYRMKMALEFSKPLTVSSDEPKGLVHAYRGFSHCRLCNCSNGSREYEFNFENTTWIWPEGYVHYIADHAVRPDEEFRSMVYRYMGVSE
jgi:hypothetical protein